MKRLADCGLASTGWRHSSGIWWFYTPSSLLFLFFSLSWRYGRAIFLSRSTSYLLAFPVPHSGFPYQPLSYLSSYLNHTQLRLHFRFPPKSHACNPFITIIYIYTLYTDYTCKGTRANEVDGGWPKMEKDSSIDLYVMRLSVQSKLRCSTTHTSS